MPEYRVTFGQQYPREPHPTLPTIAHRDGWVAVLAPDYATARAETERLLSNRWSFLYNPEDSSYPTTDLYPLGELLRVVAPGEEPLVTLLGDAPIPLAGGGQYAVTIWRDLSGEYAWRSTTSESFGPAVPLRAEA